VRFMETPLGGAYVLELERHLDDRGFFARSYCRRELAERGLDTHIAQCSVSFNRARHTLRGLHYQAPPHEEAKIVRCTAGAVYDVIVDLRPSSPTYLRWYGIELSADAGNAVYVPTGIAHGFLTLTDGATLHYQISTEHQPDAARGVRWDDPAFGIVWPAIPVVISDRDASYAPLKDHHG
jgi:dTDP-4-dehydrorhamnose 3,5-epimerase